MCDLKGIFWGVLCCLVPLTVSAGDLDPPTGPSDAGSAMYTLEDIYNRLEAGTRGTKRTGAFVEPSTGPGSSGHTLNEVMEKAPAADDASGAVAADVLSGKTYWGLATGAWGLLNGTMTHVGAQNITPGTSAQSITQGYHDGSGSVAGDTDLTAGNIASGVRIFGVTGTAVLATGNASAEDVLTGKSFSNAGSAGLTGTMQNVGQQTIIPAITNQKITQGYHNGNGYAEGDVNLVSSNIRRTVTIFGVPGKAEVMDTTEWTNPVAAGRMRNEDVAFVNGCKVTGTGTRALSAASNAVAEGYYAETTLSAVDGDLLAANIKCGKTIFGVTGTLPPGCVAKTGQTTCWNESGTLIACDGTGQDGEYQKGCDPEVTPNHGYYDFGGYDRTSLSPPCSPAGWTDNGDGTVTDNLTSLVWLKNATCFGTRPWEAALAVISDLAHGECGLTDGSSAGDWRLPNINELRSLFDPSLLMPYLPAEHPFTGVEWYCYWTSSSQENTPISAFYIGLLYAEANTATKSVPFYAWPVRGGD